AGRTESTLAYPLSHEVSEPKSWLLQSLHLGGRQGAAAASELRYNERGITSSHLNREKAHANRTALSPLRLSLHCPARDPLRRSPGSHDRRRALVRSRRGRDL